MATTMKAPRSYANLARNPTLVEKDYIKTHFRYDSQTGIITRNDRANSGGSYDKDGYLIIKVKSRQYKAHRIAWFLFYGTFPKREIDHINRDRKDNRIVNLREVDRITNVLNTTHKKNEETGVVGVYKDKCTKGLKKIYTTKVNKKTYRFYTIEEAVNFRNKHDKPI